MTNSANAVRVILFDARDTLGEVTSSVENVSNRPFRYE
jgi:hypothetical protein